jgi:4-amino-4-deoxy-L-arabinose transferase-like glycosyltransferase
MGIWVILANSIITTNKIIFNEYFQKYKMYIVVVPLLFLQLLAFKTALSMNGDNSRYICGGMSIAFTGEYKTIQKPIDIYKTTDQPGLPFLIAPLIKIFGVNILLLKSLVFCLFIGTIFLFYQIVKTIYDDNWAGILTIILGVNAFIGDFASLVMTEIPFMFFTLLSYFFYLKYDMKNKWIWSIGLGIAVVMVYFIRSLGVSMIAALLITSILRKQWKQLIIAGSVSIGIFLVWQIRNAFLGTGQSELDLFTGSKGLTFTGIQYMFVSLLQNMQTILTLIPQVLFAHDVTRFIIRPVNIIYRLITLILLIGWGQRLIKEHSIIEWFLPLSLIVLAIGTPDRNPLPMARYISVFLPIFIIYFYNGLRFLLGLNQKISLSIQYIIVIVLFTSLLFSGFAGSGYQIQKAHIGQKYPPQIQNYLNAAKWIKNNTDKNAIIGSRKENTFYLFSERRGYRTASYWSKFDSKYEKRRLGDIEKKNVRYIIVDTFSNSIKTSYRLIQKYPQRFKLIHVEGDIKNGPCLIYKINPWWEF